jgi:hypothetical protein
MSGLSHKIYVLTLIVIVVVVFGALAFLGFDYYITDKEQQFFHEQNDLFKPSGIVGHGLGFIGFFFILIGVIMYIARKRFSFLSHLGDLKYWLEFHIFLCSLGAVLVLFHSAFMFAGYAAYSFLAMILVIISGAIGLFFFYQVPRNKEGRKISLEELNKNRTNFDSDFQKQFRLDNEFIEFLNSTLKTENIHFDGTYLSVIYNHIQYEKQLMFSIKSELILRSVSKFDFKKIIKAIEDDIVLNRRILLFSKMRFYYKFWNIIHWAFTFIMMVVVIVHVVISMLFGYRWIF